jgi:hypothetical protein
MTTCPLRRTQITVVERMRGRFAAPEFLPKPKKNLRKKRCRQGRKYPERRVEYSAAHGWHRALRQAALRSLSRFFDYVEVGARRLRGGPEAPARLPLVSRTR